VWSNIGEALAPAILRTIGKTVLRSTSNLLTRVRGCRVSRYHRGRTDILDNRMDEIYSKTSDELKGYLLNGSKLSSSEVRKFETDLAANSKDFVARLNLAGYYCENILEFKRQYFEQFLWFVDNYPDHVFLSTGSFRIRRVPNALYDELISSVRRHVQSHTNKLQVLINAANLSMISDLTFSRQCADEAKALAPNDRAVLDLDKALDQFKLAMQKTGLPGILD
jgi:hypothetical protein